MLSTLRRILTLPPVQVALAMGFVSGGLSILSNVAKQYRDEVERRREELSSLAFDLAAHAGMLQSVGVPAPTPERFNPTADEFVHHPEAQAGDGVA